VALGSFTRLTSPSGSLAITPSTKEIVFMLHWLLSAPVDADVG